VAAADVSVLVVPGWGGSGPAHWQTRWERRHGYVRVEQDDWEQPDRDAWLARLDAAVAAASGPVALVAHSLGCALVAHWARRPAARGVRAALLVAPADVDELALWLDAVAAFAPVPLARLPFPACVVASTDDPYLTPARAAAFADAWGAELVDVGAAGHVNAESALGDWDAGHALLVRLLARAGR
jgi:predicted alpha/beta hydrolase family esterase